MSNCLISIHMSAHRTENIQRQSSTMIYKPLAVAIQQDRCDIRWLLSLMLLRSDHQRCKNSDLWFVKDAHSSKTIWKNRTQICGNKSKKRLFFFAFSQIGDKIRKTPQRLPIELKTSIVSGQIAHLHSHVIKTERILNTYLHTERVNSTEIWIHFSQNT